MSDELYKRYLKRTSEKAEIDGVTREKIRQRQTGKGGAASKDDETSSSFAAAAKSKSKQIKKSAAQLTTASGLELTTTNVSPAAGLELATDESPAGDLTALTLPTSEELSLTPLEFTWDVEDLEKDELEAEVQELKEDKERLGAENDHLKQTIQKNKASFDEEVDGLKTLNGTLSEEKATLEIKNASLTDTNARQATDIIELQESLKQKDAEINALNKKNADDIARSNADATGAVQALRDLQQQSQKTVEQQQRHLETQNAQLTLLNSQLDDVKATNAKLQYALEACKHEFEARVVALRAEYEASMASARADHARLLESREPQEDLQRQLGELHERYSELQTQLKIQSVDKEECEKNNVRLSSENADLQKDNQSLKSTHLVLKENNAFATTNLARAKADLEALYVELSVVRTELDTTKTRLTAALSKDDVLAKLNSENANLSSALAEMQTQLATLQGAQDQNIQLTAEIQELSRKNASLESTQRDTSSTLTKLKTEIEAQDQQLQKQSADLFARDRTIQDLQMQLSRQQTTTTAFASASRREEDEFGPIVAALRDLRPSGRQIISSPRMNKLIWVFLLSDNTFLNFESLFGDITLENRLQVAAKVDTLRSDLKMLLHSGEIAAAFEEYFSDAIITSLPQESRSFSRTKKASFDQMTNKVHEMLSRYGEGVLTSPERYNPDERLLANMAISKLWAKTPEEKEMLTKFVMHNLY